MSYNYEEQKKELFTHEGVRTLLKIYDNCKFLDKMAGAFTAAKAWAECSESSVWTLIAALDYLVELKAIEKISSYGYIQNHIYKMLP